MTTGKVNDGKVTERGLFKIKKALQKALLNDIERRPYKIYDLLVFIDLLLPIKVTRAKVEGLFNSTEK